MKVNNNTGNEIVLNIELHPGEVLKDELEARKITKSAFAMKIGMYPGHFGDIVKSKRNITANVASKLEAELGIAAEFWMALQQIMICIPSVISLNILPKLYFNFIQDTTGCLNQTNVR